MSKLLFNIYEAKASLSQLVDRAAAGEEIIIAKAGEPMVRLIPVRAKKARRTPGGWVGQVHIASDFDAPLPADLQNAFEGNE